MENNITSMLDGRTWRIALRRPSKRNALTGALFEALAASLQIAQADIRVHAIVLHGTDDCFCAGHDVSEFRALWPQTPTGSVVRCIRAFAEQQKPLIAAVNGPAIGFGATLLLHADYIVAGESAYFRFPFADLGIVPEAGATSLLARRVGDLRTRDWLLSGRTVSASEALDAGFITKTCPDADVQRMALNCAYDLAEKPPSALQATRKLVNDGCARTALEAIECELRYLNDHIPAVKWRSVPHA